jgi:hypothetical protein
MSYLLIVIGFTVPLQIGPFGNVFACEQAGGQIKTIAPVRKHVKTVCINLKANPHHWNGKPLK